MGVFPRATWLRLLEDVGFEPKSSKTRRPAASASRSSWATNLYHPPGRTPVCCFLAQASSSIACRTRSVSPVRRDLGTLLVGLLDTPNGSPGVEADQLAALDNDAPVANAKQYPVRVGGRAVGVAHPDTLSDPGLWYLLLRHRLGHLQPPSCAASYDHSIAKRYTAACTGVREWKRKMRPSHGYAYTSSCDKDSCPCVRWRGSPSRWPRSSTCRATGSSSAWAPAATGTTALGARSVCPRRGAVVARTPPSACCQT